MLRCLIVLCVGTLLAVESAPAPQQNTIDFLLDLNQDVLDKEEVQASVKPISQAQVGTTTERSGAREPAPVFEDQQADVQEIPSPEQGPTASQLNKGREEVPEDREEQDVQEEDSRSNSDDESEEKDQSSDGKKDDQEQDRDGKDQGRNEDTTIRVYGPEDENDENDESLQQKEQQDQPQETEQKVEPEVQRQPQEDFRRPQEDARPAQEDAQQPEVLVSQHADTVKQFDEAVDQEIDQVTIPDSLDDHQEIEVKPDQLFNHGSIVFDKSTFTDEDLPSTTPFSNKKWNHDHGPLAGFGPWHPKFPGGFPGHPPHADGESGRPPFFGMPPFNGPPPTRFDGPPHWHLHNHSHDHRDWHHDHQHDHDHDHGFHGHGFHRGGPWKWNRT